MGFLRNYAALTSFAVLAASVLAGCQAAPLRQPPPEDNQFPVVETFEADRMSIQPGESVTLTYKVSKASMVAIEPGVLAQSNKLEGVVMTPPITQNTTFTLRAVSRAGDTMRSLAITVRSSTASVEIASFEASPKVVQPGQASHLTWHTLGATRLQLLVEGGTVLDANASPDGALDVMPTANTTYGLVADGPGGPVNARVTVLVGTPAAIDTFHATPSQITGGSSTLEWSVRNADKVTLRDTNGNTILEAAPLSGSQIVTPTMTTTYQLVASSSAGDAVATATVQVLPSGSPRILEFTATPDSLPAPGNVTLEWNTADADTLDLVADGTSVAAFPRTPSGMVTVTFMASTLLVLNAENGAGRTSAMVMITVGMADTTPPVIAHTPIADGQPQNTDVLVSATITDADSGVAAATLFYRTRGQTSFQSLPLAAAGNDRYSASIPAAVVVPPGVDYYIHASDGATPANNATDPESAPGAVHTFDVSIPDTAPPSIVHTAISADQPEGMAVTISADVTDATQVANVTLYYKRRTDSTFSNAAMTAAGSTYTAQVPAASVTPAGVDYYLEASDTVVPANVARDPSAAPTAVHSFNVIARDTTGPSITHTPIAAGQSTGLAVTVSAVITDATGVASATLFYRAQGAGPYTQLTMSGTGGSLSATIPASAVNPPAIEYYVEAVDTATPANVSRAPAGAPGTPYSFSVTVADTAPPAIVHTPITDGQRPNQAVPISATVTDGSGLVSVTLFYRTQGAGSYSSTAMTAAGSTYTASIPAATVVSPGVEYYLRAVDASAAMNAAVLPTTAPGAGFAFRTGSQESEPNGTTGTATLLLGPGLMDNIGLGAIGTLGDQDYWIIDVPSDGQRYTVRLEVTSGGPGSCPAPVNTILTLYATNGTTVLVTDNFDGVGSCSLIDPVVDSGARALAAGRYYVRIQENGDNATIAAYEIHGTLSPAVCGNGILETAAGEQCDDGSTASGDGCSSTCRVEPEGTASAPGAVFSGDISPAGDSDIYAVTIGAGQFLRAEISNGAGGCPGDTVLELYASDAITLIGSDDNSGIGMCSLIDPIANSYAANMAAGTYYLKVRAFSSATVITGYSLDVRITSNLCGNHVVESGEQCDDGNANSNDGCSATCQYELAGTAMGTGGTFSGAIDPVGNVDWYAVVVPAGAGVKIETFAPTSGLCSSGNDTVIRFYASDRTTQLATDDEGGIASCSKLDPAVDPEVRGLAAGTYYVTVEDWLNDGLISAYVVDIQIQLPVCGDGFVSGTEQCDDSGTANGDGCSSTCQLEAPAEVESNDTRATANVLIAGGATQGTVHAALQSTTDIDVYRVDVTATSQLIAAISDGRDGCHAPMTLRLLSSTGTQLSTDSGDGPDLCGRISPGGDSGARNLAAGTYYLEVSGTAGGTYTLDARLATPGCGDTYLVAGEQCDDGNTMSGDGCSATCQFELTETEPNDSSMTAMALTGPLRTVSGRINVAGEADWYSVVVTAGQSIHAGVHNGGVDQCGSIDPDLTVFGPDSGTLEIVSDDLSGAGYCPIIYGYQLSNLAAGTYYIKVNGYSALDTFDYVLTLQVF